MGNLTSDQIAAFKSGQPVKQRFWIRQPLVADHSVYIDVLFEEGLFRSDAKSPSDPLSRVTKAGRRKHTVWNPNPNAPLRAVALRYSVEVGNGDGMFNTGYLSYWNYYDIYNAEPQECFLIHKIYIYIPSTGVFSEITHMSFIGKVLDVEYDDDGAPDKYYESSGGTGAGVREPKPAQRTAVVRTEQHGIWPTFRRPFIPQDSEMSLIDDPAGLGPYYYNVI